MSTQQPQSEAMLPSEAIVSLQREVQRLLGRCLLRLQQYEHLLKTLVAHHEIAGPIDSIPEIRDERIQDTATKTLGVLIGKLLKSYVVVSGTKHVTLNADEPAYSMAFGFRMSVEMSAEDYARTRDSLEGLVELRNELVHHFIDRFNLWQVDSCAAARDYLLTCYDRIESHHEQLRLWINHTEQTRQHAASFIQSPAFRNSIVNEIAPDGVVDWAAARCVRVLREATGLLAVDGWTPLDAAVQWIGALHPDQTPERYHCRSWPQVLFESRQFDLQYRYHEGRRQPWYRERRSREKV